MAHTRVLMSVGDDSGDLHAANLMRALRALRPDVRFVGFGMSRMAEAGLSIKDEPPEMEEGPQGVAMATCNMVDGDIVLRLLYQDGWIDVLHFQGNRVYKNGAYFEFTGGYIQWSELLHRQR